MAVYTHLTHDEVSTFLERYNVGELKSFSEIQSGIENSNFYIETTNERQFILTIFEKRVDPRDLPFFFAFMNHLAKQKIDVPYAMRDKDDQIIQTIRDKKSVLVSFLQGVGVKPDNITPELCGQMGALQAKLHVGSLSFESSRPNTMGSSAWKKIYESVKPRLHELDAEMDVVIRGQLQEFEAIKNISVPRAVVHADLFPDNVFIKNGEISGVIDFYFACNDYLGYDLALTINAWCFDQDGNCDPERLASFMDEYEMIRPMSRDEKRYMNMFLRMAALRILLTRAHDWLFADANAFVVPKDPMEYWRILNYHRNHQAIG